VSFKFLYAIFSSSLTTPQMLGNLNLKLFFRVSLLRIDADAQLASPVIWVVPARAYGKC